MRAEGACEIDMCDLIMCFAGRWRDRVELLRLSVNSPSKTTL
jgi:hypothetical protein